MNVDVATNAEKKIVGLGAIIRNWKEEIMLAGIRNTALHENVEYAEVEAMINFIIKMAIDTSLAPLIVASDSKTIFNLAKGPEKKHKGNIMIIYLGKRLYGL